MNNNPVTRDNQTHKEAFDLDSLAERWSSPLVARSQDTLDRFSGGLLNARTLANLDSLGRGPKGRVKVGRKVAYPAEALVEWMKARLCDSQEEG